jgi:hypothetical protein
MAALYCGSHAGNLKSSFIIVSPFSFRLGASGGKAGTGNPLWSDYLRSDAN